MSHRILYAAGPGHIIGTYRHWKDQQDDPGQVALTYSGQFYDVCQALDAKGYAISSYPQPDQIRDGAFIIEHRPVPFADRAGALYHVGQIWYGLSLLLSAIWFRATVIVADSGSTHWFLFSLFRLFGIQVIPSLLCVLWPKYGSMTRGEQLALRWSRPFFSRHCAAILSMSQDIQEQVTKLTSAQHPPILKFLPVYRKNEFQAVPKPCWEPAQTPSACFRVFFAGRIERDKGVFDLLYMAQRLVQEEGLAFQFDLCGTGTALEELRQAVQQVGLEEHFFCHGHCQKSAMREMFGRSHVVIVPTRTTFVEGFNQVAAEGILSGRPVITSAVCPALAYVAEAVVEVPPDDVQAYGDALLRLYQDPSFYELKRQGCLEVQDQFYNLSNSWGAALKDVLLYLDF
ncbi:MAG: glycosyltransferase family 4 protein [Oculatellaceae cyanobacterium Prado106]|jgi:glycosyltransferase involved in cell wall biosynthesis|nr:glycosyltransferase family 4 protein [Oculatellaceae cyanobacterium Prado106]